MTAPTEEKTTPTAAESSAAALVAANAPEETTPPAETAEKPEAEDSGDATEKPADDVEKLTKDDGTPYTRADVDGLQTSLKAARKDAKDRKAELDALKAKGGDRPLDEVLSEAESTAAAKWKPLMVRAAARAAFAESGLALPEDRKDEALARAVRLLDEDALTVTDAGLIEGLAEQVEAIRSDFPDLFTAPGRRAPRIQAADRPAGAKPPATSSARLAAQLTGRA